MEVLHRSRMNLFLHLNIFTLNLLIMGTSAYRNCFDANGQYTTGTFLKTYITNSALRGYVNETIPVSKLVECALQCVQLIAECKSFNYKENTDGPNVCEINSNRKESSKDEDFVKEDDSTYGEVIEAYPVFCDGPWTLIARFSNNDSTKWMKDSGKWWFAKTSRTGEIVQPNDNADMISEAFWLQKGSEFRITRSDDPTHTALLTTSGNCLGGKTFREKMASYGDFRDSVVWASDRCLGSCSVVYGGDYTSVEGFKQSRCTKGSIQSSEKIGFWCDFGHGDGSVLMIGGGGSDCEGADHGLGITEADTASFGKNGEQEYDFGDDAGREPTKSYSLNLWVR